MALSQEDIDQIRSQLLAKQTLPPDAATYSRGGSLDASLKGVGRGIERINQELPGFLDFGPSGRDILRYLGTAADVGARGLEIGQAVLDTPAYLARGGGDKPALLPAISRLFGGQPSEDPDEMRRFQPPDPGDIPGALLAGGKQLFQGDGLDVDAVLAAYDEAAQAGWGYRGLNRLAVEAAAPFGLAKTGVGLSARAPKLAETLGKIVPSSARPKVVRGIETGVEELGEGMTVPWQAEEAFGRGVAKVLGKAAGPVVRPIVSRFKGRGAEKVPGPEEPPLLDVAGEYRAAGFGERVDLPEPWDTRDVSWGSGGMMNAERLEVQRELMDELEFLEDMKARGWKEQTRSPLARIEDPSIQARMAREAKAVKTGYWWLAKRIDFEVYKERLDPSNAAAAKKWLAMLPPKYLDELGSSYTKRAIPSPDTKLRPGEEVAGTYTAGELLTGLGGDVRRMPSIIKIALGVVKKEVGTDAGHTIIHEISHHLDDFISASDVRKLYSQWQKEMFTDGMSVMEELSRLRRIQGAKKLTEDQLKAFNLAYRYEGGFKEWVAEVMTDKALRDIYMEIPSYKGVIEKVLARVKVIAKAVREFIGGDHAERVYRKLVNGDYSIAERGAMRSKRLEVEAKSFQDIVEGTVQMKEVKSLEELIARGKSRAARELGEAPPVTPPVTPPVGPAAVEAGGFFKGLGGRFVAPLRNLLDVAGEAKTVDNPVVRAMAEKLGINPSAAQNTEVGKIGIGYARQRVAIDELSDTAVSAALDVHASAGWARMGGVLPIDNNGYFGQTGKLWNDVFENYKNPAYKLTSKQKEYIKDYTRLMQDVEDMRVAAGLKPRAKTREEGWFYVPRQVKGKRGIELEKPSNPNLQRFYDEATEAFEQKGVRYLNDPRETAMLHVRAAYKEILNKQLSDALEPFSIGAADIVPQDVRGAALAAVRALRAAERESRRLGVPKAPGAKMTRQQRAAKTRENALRTDYEKNNRLFKSALAKAKAKQEDVVPGALFGQNQPENIGIAQWRKRFFRKEDFDVLDKVIGEFVPVSGKQRYKPGWISKTFQTTGNTIRFLASVGDFAMMLIHGLPLFARNPVAWGRMAYRHTEAFFNPRVQAKLIRDNLAEYQWLARNGVPIGDPEFFAALAPGQGIPLGRVAELIGKAVGSEDYGTSVRNLLRAGGKQSFGRFQAAYNAGLGWGRIQLLKGLHSGWKGTDAELAQYIRNMTGGLDSRALGVGPSRRAAEGMWLAFSPRLLRSTIALIADASRPWTPQGREALRSLGSLAAGAMTFYAISGYALGKSNEEIREGMNPLSGRRFLSHNINGDWLGIGGQVRALSQFMASMYSSLAPEVLPGGKEPLKSLWTGDMYKNPFMRFYSSRGAPGVTMAGGIVEAGAAAMGWKNVDVLPFEQVDSLPDLIKHLGTSALPFTLQQHIEQGKFLRRPSAIVGGEFFGLRGGSDPRDVKSQEIFGEEYRYIEPFMQRMIRETTEGEESQFDRIEQERRAQLLELLGEVRSWQRKDSFNIWLEVRKINNKAAGARGEAGFGIEFDTADVEADEAGLLALNQRNALYDDPEVMTENGRMK